MSGRNSLRAFLAHAKNSLQAAIEKKDQITFVIGNESADLDSITSSIVYAYLKSSVSKARLHIPLLNIPQKDIELRPELLALLPYANIDAQHLITLDDLPAFSRLEEKLPPQNTRWVLVDHNAFQGKLGSTFSDRVVGVIDHHADESKVGKDTGPEPRVITTSGSCSSLVVNHCRDAWDSFSATGTSTVAANAQGDSLADDSAVATLWDAQVAHLALASVLIDTHNMKDENKVTEHDQRAVDLLEAKINLSPNLSISYQRDCFFHKISDAKQSLDSIPLDGILRKDYKQWTEHDMHIGISSAVKPLEYLQRKVDQGSDNSKYGALVETAKTFAQERSLAIFAIMTAYQAEQGEFARELLVLGLGQGTKASKAFTEKCSEQLKLEEIECADDNGQWLHISQQKEDSASRKQVAPLIRQAMNSTE